MKSGQWSKKTKENLKCLFAKHVIPQKGPLLHLEDVFRLALDGLGYGVAVSRPRSQRPQDQQVERALQQLDPLRFLFGNVLGIACGATENAAAVRQVLIGLRDRGLLTDRKYLLVIDGAKALRTGIEEMFGREQDVQRCRNQQDPERDGCPKKI